jgi:hypothetical protein
MLQRTRSYNFFSVLNSNSKVATDREKGNERSAEKYLCSLLRPRPPSGEMAGISRAIRACVAVSRRGLASSPSVEAAAAGLRAAAATGGRKGRDGEDGRRVRWVFLGCPGVGKGTYASRLSQLLDVPHVATGDLVRDALASPGPLSTQVASWMYSSRLLSEQRRFDRWIRSTICLINYVHEGGGG